MEYIRTYFECFKAAGMDTTLEINRMRGLDCVEKLNFDHVNHDGISLMLEVARKFPAEGFIPPKLSLPPKPSLLKRSWELFKWYVRFYPFMPSKWKESSRDQAINANGKIEVENWNSVSPYSLNTRLLLALDLTAKEYLVRPQNPRVWMNPVGLYSGITRELSPMNRVSFIDIKVTDATTLKSLQADIKQQLHDLNYWGTILTMTLPKLMGKKLFTAYGKIAHYTFRRTGTFTNLGAWTIPGLPEDEWWTFGRGATARMSPVSGTAMIINGRLGLSIHFDSSIGLTHEEAQAFVEKWKKNFGETL